jgi:hypothetical protein
VFFEKDVLHMKLLIALLLWAILLVLAWPLALLLAVLLPILWILSIPFRVVGVALHSVMALIKAILLLPARLLGFRGV